MGSASTAEYGTFLTDCQWGIPFKDNGNVVTHHNILITTEDLEVWAVVKKATIETIASDTYSGT